MYKALALDIDGTLLNSNKEITPHTAKAVEKLQDKGIPVIIASGRPEQGIYHVAEALNMKEKGGYILSFNGGKITDYKTGRIVYAKTISDQYYREVCDYAGNMECSLLTYKDGCIITEKPDNKYVELESNVVKMPVKKVDNILDNLTFPVDKFLLVGEPEYMMSKVGDMAQHFKGRLNVFQSEPFFIEVVPMGIDKASSLDILLKGMGMTNKDLVACGDGRNDVTMIKYAGMGIAMDNGCEEVKSMADYITSSCDEDGVAKAIDMFF